jgi:RNA 3'-terminal phosphate cyclase (ATP)
MSTWIAIDGSEGEGGGQVLRTALSLSLVTGRPFRMERIRAGRQKPGLLRQHLTAVDAAARVGRARVSGADLGSGSLTFEPMTIEAGNYEFAVGTAGSATLVFQTLLPALLRASAESRVTVHGGTHNPFAPPFDFLDTTFLPVMVRMGASVGAKIERYGFYPAGGGTITFEVAPCTTLRPLTLLDRGPTRVHATGLVASLPGNIARRELDIVRQRLGLEKDLCCIKTIEGATASGNVLFVVVESESVVEIMTGFGAKGVSAEDVASRVCDEAERFLRSNVPVAIHLADQLLIPMALAGGGVFRTLSPSRHTRTNAGVVGRLLDVPIHFTTEADDVCRVSIGSM